MGWSMLTNRQLMLSCLGSLNSGPVCCCTQRGHLSFSPSQFLLLAFLFSSVTFSPYISPLLHALLPLCLYVHFYFVLTSRGKSIFFIPYWWIKVSWNHRGSREPTVWKNRTWLQFPVEDCVRLQEHRDQWMWMPALMSIHRFLWRVWW